MPDTERGDNGFGSHPARGGWIEICTNSENLSYLGSHPARGGWIEIWRLGGLSAGD